jgi:hypothetical protein
MHNNAYGLSPARIRYLFPNLETNKNNSEGLRNEAPNHSQDRWQTLNKNNER